MIDDHEAAAYLGGLWSVGSSGTLRTLAVVWVALGIAFLALGGLLWAGMGHTRLLLVAVTTASLVMSVLALWAAIVGVVIDAALLGLALQHPDRVGLARG